MLYSTVKFGYKRLKRVYNHDILRGYYEHRTVKQLRQLGIAHPILLSGHQKSGNTWVRFVVTNHFNILVNGAEDTLTYAQLNQISPHFFGGWPLQPFAPGFPAFFYTHDPYKVSFNHFRIIYLYRNPLDTLISYYHWHKSRRVPFSYFPPWQREKMQGVDYFVLDRLNRWIHHYRKTAARSMVTLCYERMKQDAFQEFSRLFAALDIEVNEDILHKSIAFSSIRNIQQMGRETGQLAGIARTGKLANGFEFTRDGRTGQYQSVLQPETITTAAVRLQQAGIEIDPPL
ncbi:MAG: sulfotransferase domain-containing protein [Anaerolineae bacterium]|nr:sulfotransferase domain-containing protein [Anaerolineae bacterium]